MLRSVVCRIAFLVLVAAVVPLTLDVTTAHTVKQTVMPQAALQPETQPARQAAQIGQHPTLSKAELDQLVAPVALYPDALLANVLIAATYPLEVVAADRWANANKALASSKLSAAAAEQTWDASIKVLVHAPAVLAILSKQIDWTNKLGEAVLTQEGDVFDAVQRLRKQAVEAGQLQETAEQKIIEGNTIYIEPASDEQMFVPCYSPKEAFGLWLWDDYQPYSWPPPPNYKVTNGFISGAVSGGIWSGSIDYAGRQLTVRNSVRRFSRRGSGGGETWHHDPSHRLGVNYSRLDLQTKYGSARANSEIASQDFRGYSESGSATSDRLAMLDGARGGSDRGAGLDGIGRGRDMRGFSDRGYASRTRSVAGFSGFRGGAVIRTGGNRNRGKR